MTRFIGTRNLLFVLLLLAIPAASFAGIAISVTVAPPALPVYVQPPCPVAGYLWTPGYWAWGPAGYYWVSGEWVAPPEVGFLWTPGYWGFVGGVYTWNVGYWGPHIGFYGGINYGFGYPGSGFYGGYWSGGAFRYNTAVVNVNRTVVRNVYSDRSALSRMSMANNRASFNGAGGVMARPTASDRAAMSDPHIAGRRNGRQSGAPANRTIAAGVTARPTLAGSMPTFVAYPYVIRDGAITPGQHASFLGKKHDPFLITEDPNSSNFKLPELSLPSNLSAERLDKRREIQKLINRQTEAAEQTATAAGLDAYYDRTLAMLSSSAVRNAFDLSAEPEGVRRKYGRTTYGQGCLLARRLVEAGVKFVNVYFSSNIGGQSTSDGGWDTHGFNNTFMYPILKARHLPLTEHTLPVFLNDLDERGLLETTLVVWMGEFGRTPKLNSQTSRDHWPQCYTVLLAGGGVKRGYVHGRSDRQGAFPDRDGVPIEDLSATMFALLGIDPATELLDRLNRPHPISSGRAVTGVMA